MIACWIGAFYLYSWWKTPRVDNFRCSMLLPIFWIYRHGEVITCTHQFCKEIVGSPRSVLHVSKSWHDAIPSYPPFPTPVPTNRGYSLCWSFAIGAFWSQGGAMDFFPKFPQRSCVESNWHRWHSGFMWFLLSDAEVKPQECGKRRTTFGRLH